MRVAKPCHEHAASDDDGPVVTSLAGSADGGERMPALSALQGRHPGGARAGTAPRLDDAGRRAARRPGGSGRPAVRRPGRPHAGSCAGRCQDRSQAMSSSPTRSSTSSMRCAASGGCTSGRTPTRSIAAGGGRTWSAPSSSPPSSWRSAPRRREACLAGPTTIGKVRGQALPLDGGAQSVRHHPSVGIAANPGRRGQGRANTNCLSQTCGRRRRPLRA